MENIPFKLKRLFKREEEIFEKLPFVTSDEMERVLRLELVEIGKKIEAFSTKKVFLPDFASPIPTAFKKADAKPKT